MFAKGSTAYNRFLGDAGHKPNPCIAPIDEGPFYAIKVVMGDLGTFAGLRTDSHARVIAKNGDPIDGLYAVGNDAASVMGGNYPGGGITLGPALAFGYIAGRHLAEATPASPDDLGDGLRHPQEGQAARCREREGAIEQRCNARTAAGLHTV